MPTPFVPSAEPWTHDWDYRVISRFGDPDYGPEHGFIATIQADSDDQAEKRVAAYCTANFDDNFYGAVAHGEGPAGSGLYRVRVTWARR